MARGQVAALSVMTRWGVVPLEAIARSKNLRVATMSRVGDTQASTICPYPWMAR